MIDYGVAEFLGIFLIGFPCFVFFIVVLQKGILGFFSKYFETDPIIAYQYHIKGGR